MSPIDASPAMLARLGDDDLVPPRLRAVRADMANLPFTGQVFALVFVAYNTLFNLPDLDGQRSCFESVRRVLRDGAAFVVEAFVPDEDDRPRDGVEARSIEIDRVVLTASRLDPATQTIAGQHVEITASRGAATSVVPPLPASGPTRRARRQRQASRLEHRWASWRRDAFTDDSDDARVGLPVCGLSVSPARSSTRVASPNSSPGSPRRASRSTTAPDLSVTRISEPNRTRPASTCATADSGTSPRYCFGLPEMPSAHANNRPPVSTSAICLAEGKVTRTSGSTPVASSSAVPSLHRRARHASGWDHAVPVHTYAGDDFLATCEQRCCQRGEIDSRHPSVALPVLARGERHLVSAWYSWRQIAASAPDRLAPFCS